VSRRRLPLSIALLVVVALAGSLALTSCGSGNGRGEKVTDIASSDGQTFGDYAVASSAQGDVALAFETGGEIKLQELPASSGSWTKPFPLTPNATERASEGALYGDRPALAYDGSGRLLVAWTASPDPDLFCDGHHWQIEAQLREPDGRWQPKKLIAPLPEGVCGVGVPNALQLSGGEHDFALSWPSRLRILDGNRWSPSVSVDTPYAPPSVEFLADDRALALWRKPDGTIVSAPLTVSGRLGKEETLADKASDLTVASSPTRAIAAWTRGSRIWARIWSHGKWGETKRLVLNGSDQPQSIAVAITRRRAVVAWAQGGEWASSGYVSKKQGDWSSPARLLPYGELADSVRAAALDSGEIVVLGPRLDGMEVVHIPASGKIERSHLDFLWGRWDVFSAGSKAAVLARQVNESPWENGEDPHLLVWVYRP